MQHRASAMQITMDKEEKISSRCEPEVSRDNGKMITSFLPLISVLTLPRVPALDNMCTEIIRHILQFLDYRSKKMLRGVSSTLKNRVEGCGDKMVHYWRFSAKFTTDQLIKFADEVKTVIGFEVRDGTDDGVKYLVKKHPEILMFKLRRGEFGTMFQLGSEFTSNGLLQILQFCGSTLRSLDISVKNITGENLSEYKGTLPCLENLNMSYCYQLTDKGLLQILQFCGSTLRSLNLIETEITGENLSKYNGILPCLEILNMSYCTQLTNKGLLQILQLCGSTLRSLNLIETEITGENLSEYKGALPCLEILNMRYCKQLTDKGLLQILQLCGSTLRSLNLFETEITGENLSEYKGTLPCLENLNMFCCRHLTDKGLLQILQLCGSKLIFLDISETNITGEYLSEYKGTLPCLENLNMNYCRHLTDKGLLQILQLCGSTLRSLDIGCTNITGEYLSEYKGTLPCLEILNMRYCKHLTDRGLLQILQLCGSTLRSLNLLKTEITGENLSEYKGTLPCLENLNMSYCIHLTDKGLLQILQLCGSTLRSLNIVDTNITKNNLSEYSHLRVAS
ncbi:F-box/LRR-repeat protein 20 isoform X1 [Eurytemora carolleeae]|uniref:F-box/LRR-repeat protein 20 isoform X1 n=2 Tax=Eurytemora carolleeae TaxID=1294199 RepID=UPI000C78BC9A|nr:F-box/LRR-repeat protein 20 isoform X1 [Eurytemora carolleeae]|eukprot:XP_023332834.1 F-box/LRR-repeat protein 20-like isoform X1 [Eurytemora affinis]